jgi:large subunit ribosomal protein L21
MSYAVIASGGKQYRVSEGQIVRLEKLPNEIGDTFDFEQVLMVAQGENYLIGAPFLQGSVVSCEVVKHGRGDKIKIVKMRRRKHYRKQMGHRQDFTEVKIVSIK